MDKPGFLGRYELKRELGRGAMGVVYEGWDGQLLRKVAVKTILTGKLLDPAVASDYSERFMREARNAGQLIHPNIVTVFDFGNEGDIAYLVMELINGKELKAYLDAGHVFGIPEAVRIGCQLLEALDYVHERHIFHRDIKPANVMLEAGTGRVRLTDFGVARFAPNAGQEGSRAGTMVGTSSYMSPEQIKGLPAGVGADVFATGVLLYQCLTLQKPFVGSTEWDIWQKIVNDEPPPMSRYRDQVPAALERAVLRALAKDPRERPASARAMIGELQAAIEGEPVDAEATCMLAVAGAGRGPGDTPVQPLVNEALQHSPARPEVAPDPSRGQQVNAWHDHEIEIEFWRSIKGSRDAEEFRLYLERYPDGHYAELARRKLASLRTETPPAEAAPVAAPAAAVVPPPDAAARRTSRYGLVLVAALAVASGGVLMASTMRAPPAGVKPPSASAPGPALQSVPADGAGLPVRPDGVAGPATAGEHPGKVPLAGAQPRQAGPAELPQPVDPKAIRATDERRVREQNLARARAAGEQAALHARPKAPPIPVDPGMKGDTGNQRAEGGKAEAPAAPPEPAASIAGNAEAAQGGDSEGRDRHALINYGHGDIYGRGNHAADPGRQNPEDTAGSNGASRPDSARDNWLQAAQRAEREGRMDDAVKYYTWAYRRGSGRAARALGDIYARGDSAAGRNLSEQLQWYEKAKALGLAVPAPDKR